jgi:hypothetical protein
MAVGVQQAAGDETVFCVLDSTKMGPAPQEGSVSPCLFPFPHSFFAAGMMFVIVILVNGDHVMRRINDRDSQTARAPDEPIVITRTPYGERRDFASK